MGRYSRFSGNEEDVMEVFLKEQRITNEMINDENKGLGSYPIVLKDLIRKKMIMKEKGHVKITERGLSAIKQQIRSGEFWVAPLRPKRFR